LGDFCIGWQALTNAGFQSRIRKNAGKFKRAMRAAELVAELLEQGGQVPQVRCPRGSQPKHLAHVS